MLPSTQRDFFEAKKAVLGCKKAKKPLCIDNKKSGIFHLKYPRFLLLLTNKKYGVGAVTARIFLSGGHRAQKGKSLNKDIKILTFCISYGIIRYPMDKECIFMFKRHIRVFSLLLALIMCLFVFVGCNTEEQEAQKAQIAELEKTLATALDKITALEGVNSEANEKIEELIEEKEAAKQEIDALKNDRDEAFSHLEELKEMTELFVQSIIQGEIYICVGDTWVTTENVDDVLGDGGSVSYDVFNRTLVLKNVDLTCKDNFIYATRDLTILVVGENKITVEPDSGEFLTGIYCAGSYSSNLTILGEGSLEVNVLTNDKTIAATGIFADDLAIMTEKVSVTVGDAITSSNAISCNNAKGAHVEIKLCAGKAQDSLAFSAEQNIHLNSCSLEATSADAVNVSKGVYSIGAITLVDSTITANSGIAYSGAYDVHCLGSIMLHGKSEITGNTVHATDGIHTFERKIRIYIDQGHNPSGNHNAGANNGTIFEEDITYNVGVLLAEMLRADGRFEVCLSRPTPDTVLGTDNATSLEARVLGARRFDADYFISIHANSYTDSSVTGTEVLTYSLEGESAELAEKLLEGMVATTGLRNRGVKPRTDLYVLNNATMPAVLVELAFISNPTDAALMTEQPGLFVTGLYNGIIAHLGLAAQQG